MRALGITQVVICATQYPNCIRATAFDAVARDFLILDATSAANAAVAQANIYDMQQIGIDCLCFEGWMAREKRRDPGRERLAADWG